jgi:PIN domain nuclease of toxin-antitoxin system
MSEPRFVIDTSAILAVLLEEEEASHFLDLIVAADCCYLGAPTSIETAMVFNPARVTGPRRISIYFSMKVLFASNRSVQLWLATPRQPGSSLARGDILLDLISEIASAMPCQRVFSCLCCSRELTSAALTSNVW